MKQTTAVVQVASRQPAGIAKRERIDLMRDLQREIFGFRA
jgi:hypothetical protein